MEVAPSSAIAFVDRPERALCPLALRSHGARQALVGRPSEVDALRHEMAAASGGRLACVSVEGEPGIGKTRLLLATQELAEQAGFTPLAIAADEELRGPFLLARSLLGCRPLQERSLGTPADAAVRRSLDALSGHDDPALAALPGSDRLLRTYDLAAVAIAELSALGPVAILLDDLQWADEDSLRLIRYVLRSASEQPILLVVAVRPEEMAGVTELVNLVADMERLGLLRRLRLHRFSLAETTELLRLALGGPVDPTSAATIQAQAEGVPFIVEELVKAYRESGMIRPADDTWTLSRNAVRLLPSAVRTLIGRRAARLPETTRALLADAGVLGRTFSLRDLQAITERLDGRSDDTLDLAEQLEPAMAAGLLVQYPEGSAADYGFPHEQVRDFVVASLAATRRRRIHALIVELLSASGEPAPESLPILAHHARAAGDAEASARFAIGAAREALGRGAPDEVLRSVELGLPVVLDARDRIALLLMRDDALGLLRRSSERMEGLVEVSALVDALADPGLGLQVALRRAAALREVGDRETAAEVARGVRGRAAAMGERQIELAAALELGQCLLGSPIGDSFVPVISEVDADGAEEAYREALALAEALGDDRAIASASRELGAVAMARVRGAYLDIVTSGVMPPNVMEHAPLMGPYMEALGRFQSAIETYGRLGDRHGMMSAILALAYATLGADFVFAGAIRRLEEVRRLSGRLTTLATESERVLAELQLLYGIHVYAREFGGPDLAISRGEEAYRLARTHGDRALEFLAAGGVAMAQVQVGESVAAAEWLERAAAAAAASPTPLRSRRMTMWRGRLAAASDDVAGLRTHLERAIASADEQGRPAARCEAHALFAIEAARLGRERSDDELLGRAVDAAEQAISLSEALPGHPPWRARALAAITHVRLARPERGDALETARAALQDLQASELQELLLDIWLPCAQAVLAAGSETEAAAVRERLAMRLGAVTLHTIDEDIRTRWFATSPQSDLVALVGGVEAAQATFAQSPIFAAYQGLVHAQLDLTAEQQQLLGYMTEARSDADMATALGLSEEQVADDVDALLERMHAPSRAAATAFALTQRLV